MSESRADRITENRCVNCGAPDAEDFCAGGCGAPMCSGCYESVWESVCQGCDPTTVYQDDEDESRAQLGRKA